LLWPRSEISNRIPSWITENNRCRDESRNTVNHIRKVM
jgi:hypothetical protein